MAKIVAFCQSEFEQNRRMNNSLEQRDYLSSSGFMLRSSVGFLKLKSITEFGEMSLLVEETSGFAYAMMEAFLF